MSDFGSIYGQFERSKKAISSHIAKYEGSVKTWSKHGKMGRSVKDVEKLQKSLESMIQANEGIAIEYKSLLDSSESAKQFSSDRRHKEDVKAIKDMMDKLEKHILDTRSSMEAVMEVLSSDSPEFRAERGDFEVYYNGEYDEA